MCCPVGDAYSMAVKLVTDSTCDLPQDLARDWDITVVPCNVHFGDEVYKDGIDMGADEFYGRLVSSATLPTTAQPSVNDFLQVYKALSVEGHDIVSIHLSAKLSGTLNSAIQARALLTEAAQPGGAKDSGSIEIIDSRMASVGLGLIALAAAHVVRAGGSWGEVVESVRSSLPRTHCYFLLDTLEYLQKGGRIGKARAFLGSLLGVKPILMVKDGEAHPVERVRTREKGLRKLAEILTGLAHAKHLAVLHSTTPGDAEALRERLGDLAPEGGIVMARFGPVVGTYLGPGALGVSLLSSSE